MFDQIYLINLKCRPKRLIQSLYQFDHYHLCSKIHIIEAVDGIPNHGNQMIPKGAIGYNHSWKKVLHHAIINKHQKILIFDDDIILIKNFHQKLIGLMTKLESFKVLLLGTSQHSFQINPSLNKDQMKMDNIYHPLNTDGSFAVALGDKHIIKHIYQKLTSNINQYFDSDILRDIYKKHYDDCWFPYPNLVIANVNKSDIRDDRDQSKINHKFRWDPSLYHHHSLPLISIIVPVYNGSKTIVNSLESLFNQTYRPMEIIVIDDCSQDNTYSLVESLFKRWQYRIGIRSLDCHLIKHQNNLGCYAARNTGIKQAKGDLIGFQDADDISLPIRMEKQIINIMKYDVLFSVCLILRTHLDNLSLNMPKLKKQIIDSRIHGDRYCCRGKVGLVTTVFRKKVFSDELYDEYMKWGGDDVFLRRLLSKYGFRIDGKMMNYLDSSPTLISKMCHRHNKIMYLSYQMTGQNLTSQRKKVEEKNRVKK